MKVGENTELRIKDARWGNLDNGRFPEKLPDNRRPTFPGAKWELDPEVTFYNDETDIAFGIRNLELFTNVTPEEFEAIDLETILNRTFNPNQPSFFLSPGTNSKDLGLSFMIFPEPAPGNFLVATGQVVNSSGTVTGAFIHAVQAAVPAPASIVLFGLGGGGLVAGAWLRRWRARLRANRPTQG